MIKTLNYIFTKERVHHPDHYQGCSDAGAQILSSSMFPYPPLLTEECINVIEALDLDFCMGNCFKYLWRLDRKNKFFFFSNYVEDLQKAMWYVDRYIGVRHNKGKTVESWIYELKNQIHSSLISKVIYKA